jgi:hypothetical protein
MTISKWKLIKEDVLSSGTKTARWESENCTSGTVTIIKIGHEFFGRDTNGMLVSAFADTSDEVVKLMESCFNWNVVR